MKNARIPRFVVAMPLLVVVLIPLAAAVYMYREAPSSPLASGTSCPSFQVSAIRGGVSRGNTGRRAILFFSPSCSHCQRLLSQIGVLQKRFPQWFAGPGSLRWELISNASRSETAAFARTQSLPVYFDEHGTAMRSMHGISVPYLVLVDEYSKVRYTQTGERELGYNEAIFRSFYETGEPHR